MVKSQRDPSVLERNHPRLRRLSEEEYGLVRRLACVLTQKQMAAFLAISHETFQDILSRDRRAREEFDTGRAQVIGEIGTSLVQRALDGDLSAQIFFLKTQAGWRETARLEVVEPNEEAGEKLAALLGWDLDGVVVEVEPESKKKRLPKLDVPDPNGDEPKRKGRPKGMNGRVAS